MSEKTVKKSGAGPVVCTVLGILLLALVIGAFLPMTAARLMGYDIYNIVSGSMAPTIPVGSAIFVKDTDPAALTGGTIIAFESGGSVISHRVTANDPAAQELTTRGDANANEDFQAVPYTAVIGVVSAHVPVLGSVMTVLTTTGGRLAALGVALCGAALLALAGNLRKKRA